MRKKNVFYNRKQVYLMYNRKIIQKVKQKQKQITNQYKHECIKNVQILKYSAVIFEEKTKKWYLIFVNGEQNF